LRRFRFSRKAACSRCSRRSFWVSLGRSVIGAKLERDLPAVKARIEGRLV
jgi:hypothetical protein